LPNRVPRSRGEALQESRARPGQVLDSWRKHKKQTSLLDSQSSEAAVLVSFF